MNKIITTLVLLAVSMLTLTIANADEGCRAKIQPNEILFFTINVQNNKLIAEDGYAVKFYGKGISNKVRAQGITIDITSMTITKGDKRDTILLVFTETKFGTVALQNLGNKVVAFEKAVIIDLRTNRISSEIFCK
jgi:hypothetical protein